MRRCRGLIVAAVALALGGCGDSAEPTSEDYGNLLNSPGGLIVLEEEHPTGWKRPDCQACHEVRNTHTVNRTGLPNCDQLPQPPVEPCIDLEEIQDIIHAQGEQSCPLCHGDNGVEP